jgi:membrane protein implicated in regulation of membrane protease activity
MVDKTMAGIAREAAIGESGKVVKVPTEGSRGIVRFTTPLLGDDEWDFISEGDVELGDRVHIKDISGNTLIVVKLS